MARAVADVEIGGLVIPGDLLPRLVAALRGTYSALVTDKMTDEEVFAVVQTHFLTQVLQNYEAQQAQASLPDQVAALQTKFTDLAAKARDKAVADAAKIKKKA